MKIKIYNPITKKESNIDEYGRTAKNIYKYMIVNQGADPTTILPDNITYINGRFIKVKTPVNSNNVRRLTYAQVKLSKGNKLNNMSYLRKIMKSYAGQTVKLVKRYSKFDGPDLADIDAMEAAGSGTMNIDSIENLEEIEEEETFLIDTSFNKWWKKYSIFFWINSQEELFGEWNDILKADPKLQAQLLILSLDKVDKENVNQYFLDGITNCFFTPIKDWALDCEEKSKSKSAEKKYKSINKKVDKYINKYSKGIPENDMPAVCNDLQIAVEIDLPSTVLDKTKFIEVASQKKPLKKFRFINTRLNHIELNKITCKDNYEEVDQETIDKIKEYSIENDQFILWKETRIGVTQINTLDQIYKLKTVGGYMDAWREFEEKYNFSDYSIEKNKNSELTEFLDLALNCNQSISFVPKCRYINPMDIVKAYFEEDSEYQDLKDTWENPNYAHQKDQPGYKETGKVFDWCDTLPELNHIDIRKAYTQGHKCTEYQGYLGKITDFRKTDKIVGLGIYQIKNIKFNGCEAIKNMKCLHENQAYPSPELEFYKKLGITFDIVIGCWGSKFDFQFTPKMYEKENGLSHYCKWYGCLMKTNEKDRYNFDCKDIQFAKLNSYNCDNDIRYNYNEKSGVIEYDKKYVYHRYHIASFISSYARISLLEQVLRFPDFNQIVSVVVDGIYYKGDVEVGGLFSDKEKKTIQMNNTLEYVADCESTRDFSCGDFRENNKVEVHLGAGGCGKTHSNLVDKGLINPLFVAPSWKLARNKKAEYGIDSTTFYHTLCEDPCFWQKLYTNYSTFVFDEISMLSDEAKEILLERYPEHKIIFCGDLGYQLPPIEGSEFIVGDLPVFHHTTNYRCKCPKLEKLLLSLRRCIKGSYANIPPRMIIKSLGIDTIKVEDMDYCSDDFIIASTNKKKDIYTEKFKHLEKYLVKENTRDFSNGDIIIGSKPEKVKCEIRHGYTISSAQGETAKNKLFIDKDNIRCLRTLYTALSRARTLDQIKFTFV